MEQGCTKKREAEEIVNEGKRCKPDKFHHVELFLKLASEISDSRKQRIATMGFQSFLEMSSVSNVDCIYFWLTKHFNTSSCSIEMPNGFKFPITSSAVHNFFGIPIGGLPVVTKPTESTYEFIKQELGTTTPTIDYLFSIINDDLPEDKFCRIFILIVLSLFVAPNSSGVVSKFVYNAIVDINRIAQYDWCLLALSYMVYSIKKARIKNRSSNKFLPGGSKLLLVISYFEFLIITELKLPNIEPRLPIWSANMLNSYMALDALHGKDNEYGRLPRKHISSTPFNDPDFFELPEEISDYIDSKFTDISLPQDKMILQMQSQKFFRNIIRNSTPTLKTYVDDMHSLFLKTSSSSANLQFKLDMSENKFKVPSTKQVLAMESPPNFPMLTLPTIIDEFKEININEILEDLVKDFSDSVNITSSNFSLSFNVPTFEELSFPELFVKTQSPKASPPIDVSALLHQYMSESRSTYRRVEETKFCLPLFRFLLPGEHLEDFSTHEPDEGCLLHGNSKAEPINNSQYEAADAPSFDGISNSIYIVENDPSNFDIITSEASKPFATGSSSQFSLQTSNHNAHSNSHVNPNVPATENPIRILDFMSPKGYPKNIATPIEDPLLVQVLEQHEGRSSKFSRPQPSTWHQGVNKCFKSGKLVIQEQQQSSKKVIQSNGIENDFYQLMVGTLLKLTHSQRIFEIEGIWVDQKTITLSFKTCGWINPRVVGCFTKLKNKDQLNRGRKGLLLNSDLLEHVVSIDDMEKLMNPVLNHSNPRNKQILHESTVGFSFLNASLVKMPVFKEKQWILIVTNFRAKFFEIMNPYYNGDTFLPTISAVIYNLKTLFSATYGNSTSFNIGNFESRFVATPKVIFRYDSGIFLLQYINKYKGVGLECLSTDDIQALCEKFLFEIVTSNDNEIQLPLVSSFLQSHGFRIFK